MTTYTEAIENTLDTNVCIGPTGKPVQHVRFAKKTPPDNVLDNVGWKTLPKLIFESAQEQDRLTKMMEEERKSREVECEVNRLRYEKLMTRIDVLLHHAEQDQKERIVMMHDIRDLSRPQKAKNFYRMAIIKMSPNYEWDEEKDRWYLRNVDAIAVRIPAHNFYNHIREIKRYGNRTNQDAEIIVSFDSPNPVNLYNRLKVEHSKDFTFVQPVGIRFDPGTEEDLVKAVRNMHEVRAQYPNNQ